MIIIEVTTKPNGEPENIRIKWPDRFTRRQKRRFLATLKKWITVLEENW